MRPRHALNHYFPLVLEGRQGKLGDHVKVIKLNPVENILKTIVEGHDVSMERRETLVQKLLRDRLVAEEKCVDVVAIANGVALKTVAFILVRNTQLISVVPFKLHRLLIPCKVPLEFPRVTPDLT